MARRLAGLAWGPSARAAAVAVSSTGVAFAAIKTLPAATDAWAAALGVGQWLAGLPAAAAARSTVGQPHAVATVTDPTDLVALPALAIVWWILIRRARASESRYDANRTRGQG